MVIMMERTTWYRHYPHPYKYNCCYIPVNQTGHCFDGQLECGDKSEECELLESESESEPACELDAPDRAELEPPEDGLAGPTAVGKTMGAGRAGSFDAKRRTAAAWGLGFDCDM